ncbi:MAG: hypothetical protein EOP09_18490 [Proteobacteria bacterium]|nr:MAG: hypothetical protein EOP09_18490 [Pseudomonadota bacterium]
MSRISVCLSLGFLSLIILTNARASGTLTVSGKLTSITDQVYVVETKNEIYKIIRSEVPKSDQERIDRPDAQVHLFVPFSGVQAVQYKSSLNTRGLKKSSIRR